MGEGSENEERRNLKVSMFGGESMLEPLASPRTEKNARKLDFGGSHYYSITSKPVSYTVL